MFTFCWGDKLVCFPGIETLCELTGLHDRAVREAIDGLVAKGAIASKRRRPVKGRVGRGSTSMEYVLNPYPPAHHGDRFRPTDDAVACSCGERHLAGAMKFIADPAHHRQLADQPARAAEWSTDQSAPDTRPTGTTRRGSIQGEPAKKITARSSTNGHDAPDSRQRYNRQALTVYVGDELKTFASIEKRDAALRAQRDLEREAVRVFFGIVLHATEPLIAHQALAGAA